MDLSSSAPLIAVFAVVVLWPKLHVRLELLKSRIRASSRGTLRGLEEGLEPHAEYFTQLFAPLGLEPSKAGFDDESAQATLIFVDAERRVIACVQIGAGISLVLLSCTVDDTIVTTYVGPGAWGLTTPRRRERVSLDADLAKALSDHREAVGSARVMDDLDELERFRADFVEAGLCRPIDDEWLAPTWRGASVWANALQRSRAAILATAGHAWRTGAPPLPARFRVAFQKSLRRHMSRPLPSRYRWVLGGGTAVAFAVLGLVVWPWRVALGLFVVVTVHELGHAAAMVLTGHRDVRVFFLPLLGGLAQGRATRPSVVRDAVVLLAGPLPGLLLAWPLVQADSLTLRVLGTIALVLNALNLLPALPLDGGRLAASVLPARAGVQVAFGALSAVGLGALALYWRDPLFAFLALWIGHTTYQRRGFVRIVATLGSEAIALRDLDTDARLEALHALVAREGIHDVMLAVALVEALDDVAERSRSSLVTRGVVGAVYLAILALAVYVLAPTFIA